MKSYQKHLRIYITILYLIFSSTNSYTQIIPANLGNHGIPVWNKNLMGFNLGDFANNNEIGQNIFDFKNGGSGNTYSGYTNNIENAGLGSNVLYRFYTGEYGNCYNRWYGGSGSTFKNTSGVGMFIPNDFTFHQIQYNQYNTNLDVNARNALYNNYATYNDVPSISYQTAEAAQPKNNIIFPFIRLITNNRVKDAKGIFNLPITAHYRNYTKDFFIELINTWAKSAGVNASYANTYQPRVETFEKTNIIATINSLSSALPGKVSLDAVVASGNLTPQFKEIVLQNLDGYLTLIKNRVKVKHIELGNELYGRLVNTGACSGGVPTSPTYNEFKTQYPNLLGITALNDIVFYIDPCNNTTTPISTIIQSGNVYGNLCKMYMALIREAVYNLWLNTDGTSEPVLKAFYADIKDNLKFGVPVSGGFPNVPNGFSTIDQFLYNHQTSIGFDAFIHHNYYSAPSYSGTLDEKYDLLKTYYVNRFNTFYKQTYPNLLQTNYPNISELWFTEWAHEDPNNINNTLLEGMNYMDEFMSFWDLNSNLNLTASNFTRTDILKVANHHMLWAPYTSNSQLVNFQYNTTTPRLRTMFYAHKLLLPIMDNNTKMIYQLNGGFTSPNSDIYFRTFEVPDANFGQPVPFRPDYTFLNKICIYYNNKNNNSTAYTFNLNSAVQNYIASILPTQIYSVKRSSIFANKLYAARGIGPIPSSTETITTDANTYVQVESNVSIFPNSQWSALPIKKYSAGYYEVQIIRKTGTGSSSGRLKSTETNDKLFPNPVKSGESINLTINSESSKNIWINVFTTDGRQLKSIQFNLQKGINSLQIKTDDLPKGIYLLHNSDQLVNEKFIVN